MDLDGAALGIDPAWYRAAGTILVAFGISVAADRAIVGSAAGTGHERMTAGAIVAVVGVLMVVAGGLRLGHARRPAAHTRRTPDRTLLVAAVLMGLTRGVPQLRDVIDHVQADRDEPTTTLVHIIRLVLTAVLTMALCWLARGRSHHWLQRPLGRSSRC